MIDKTANISVRIDDAAEGSAVDEFKRVVAVPLPVGLHPLQMPQLLVVKSDKSVARTKVARDPIALNAGTDDVGALERHAGECDCRLPPVPLFDDIDITAIAVDDLSAVATGGTPAYALAFQHDDRKAALGQRKPGRDAGEAGSDDTDIGTDVTGERRTFRGRCGGRVVAADIAGRADVVRRS
jgi:hypothetical protein